MNVAQLATVTAPASSFTAGGFVASKSGWSFTGVTIKLTVSVAVENAVAPPLLLVLASSPFAPRVWSQARNVRAADNVALKSEFGSKYTRVFASAANKRAMLFATAPSSDQLVPLLSEYHQVPFASAAVIAMPVTAPVSTSVTLS